MQNSKCNVHSKKCPEGEPLDQSKKLVYSLTTELNEIKWNADYADKSADKRGAMSKT
jgi:hypothetical protein